MLIEVAVTSGMSTTLRQTLIINAPKHAEWFVRDLTFNRAASSLDLYSRARIVLRALGTDASGLSAAIVPFLKRELSAGISNAEKLIDVLGFMRLLQTELSSFRRSRATSRSNHPARLIQCYATGEPVASLFPLSSSAYLRADANAQA